MQIRAGGHLAQQLFPNVAPMSMFGLTFDVFDLGAVVLSVVMTVYILVGGMRSVAMADVIQGALLLSGMLVAGFIAVSALGGVRGYLDRVSQLPAESLSLPGATGRYTAWSVLTLCLFASLSSMIQPAQWMRYYAARSTATLKQSALIFAIVLPLCYFFGVMLVGLGARALYPPQRVERTVAVQGTDDGRPQPEALTAAELEPHPTVGRWDQALVAVLKNEGPAVLGTAGPLIIVIVLVAVLAASMSTADSNLHAVSGVVLRDVYDRFLRPGAGERERAWVGRGIIVGATLLAVTLVHIGERDPHFAPLKMIVELQFVAMAFSCQLLPATIDILFIRRGTRAGVICGMIAGLVAVTCFTPLPEKLLGSTTGKSVADSTTYLKTLFDIGFCGLLVNVPVFVFVSLITRRPPADRIAQFVRIMQTKG
jgi:SSS family solute:Na+ symporter